MNQHLSGFLRPFRRPPTRQALRARPAKALAALLVPIALFWVPLSTQAENDMARYNSTSPATAEIAWMSGGVGGEARDEMRKASVAYNVHVLFSDRRGRYLADVPYTVTRHDGRQVLSGIAEGPLLYLKLPPGSYRVGVEIDGAWQRRSVQAGVSGRPTRLMFVGRRG